MKNKGNTPSKASLLRKKAEAKLKGQQKEAEIPSSESDMLKLIHELQVHQIEMEMINEELTQTKHLAEIAGEKYTTLFDFAPLGYFTLNSGGTIILLNLSAAQMLGKERQRLINKRFEQYLTPDTRIVFHDFLNEIFNNNDKKSCEVTFESDDKPIVFVQLTGTRAIYENHCLITATDITGRKQIENALKESEERYALVIDASEQGIWDWNIATNEVFFSKQWKKQIGYEDHEIRNSFNSWIEHLHPEERKACQNAVQSYLDKPVEHFCLEFRFRHKNGSYRWISNKASSILNTEGRVIRMFGAHTDITDRKLAELQIQHQNEELQKLNATKDKFFSIIAHDLKSPFNSIIGFSELLVDQIKAKDYEGIEKFASIILQSSNRAMNLLMNLMEWSRSQTGKMQFKPEPFDLQELITDITMLFDDIAGQKKINIKKELPQEAFAFADYAMIHTVLRNLISNAIKFTKPDGEIILSIIEGKNKLTISVKDNGVGIAKDRISRLFMMEENNSTPGTANEEGTGLGLILCKEFIEKHGEKIQVESEENSGTTFSFTLPYASESRIYDSDHLPPPSEQNNSIRPLKILIAEDDEISEKLMDLNMRIFCKEILKVKTGTEAVNTCRANPDIDLVLMDIRMPKLGGNEATQQIREFNKDVVIIAQTAYGLSGDRENATELGYNDYITKPIQRMELQALIHKHFRNE